MGAAQRFAVQLPQARHTNCQKANDLAREAVGWNGGLGGWRQTLDCASGMSEPHGTTGVRPNHTLHTITPAQRTLKREHAPHNGQSVRASTTPALRTTGSRTTAARRALTQRALVNVTRE
jgi:hypothetical protein